jgi:D-sedoheptulose 7-phosphate isomerase
LLRLDADKSADKVRRMYGMTLSPSAFLQRIAQELERIDYRELQSLADAVWRAFRDRRFVFVIGNGGSGSNASHFCEDAGKCTLRVADYDRDTPRLRILSLTDNTPYILAWANDAGFERVFAEQLKNLASPGDLLIAISGSGNSPNILRAVEWAKAHGVHTFGCTGYSGGKLRSLADQGLHVSVDDMGTVESIHLAAFHWVVGDLARRMQNQESENGRSQSEIPATAR